MAGQQKTLFSAEELRKRARRIKGEIVASAKLPPALKAVLNALWHFCAGNRFCWPSHQTIAERVGYAWPASRRALQLKLAELQRRGLIVIESAERLDGSTTSNKYRIVWGNLQRTGAVLTRDRAQRPRSGKRGGGAQASAGGALRQAPLEMELKRNGNPSTPSGSSDGGGDGNRPAVNRGLPDGRTPNGRGAWTGHIGDLGERAERLRVFHDAVTAGLLADCAVDRVRFLAATIQARKRPEGMVSGWLIQIVESSNWRRIDPAYIKRAIQQLTDLGLRLTAEERQQLTADN